eukprot:6209983-Pleurochrysis_carterae.AAC.1
MPFQDQRGSPPALDEHKLLTFYITAYALKAPSSDGSCVMRWLCARSMLHTYLKRHHTYRYTNYKYVYELHALEVSHGRRKAICCVSLLRCDYES